MTQWSVIFLVLIGLVGCDQRGEEDVGQTEEGSLVLGQSEVVERVPRAVSPGGRQLVLDGFNGIVRLDGTEEEVAQLVFEKRARGQDDDAAREVLDDIELEEQGDASRYEFVMRSDQTERSRVDVSGTVPHRTQLRIDFMNGGVALSGVEGPLEIEHQNGNVQIAGAAASVRVGIRNGNIEVGMQQVPQGTGIELTTSNGNLVLTVPESVSAQIAAQTEAGTISTQDLVFESRQLEPRGAGARFDAQLGGGNATVDMRTENGSITLRGGRAAPIPADSMIVEPEDTTIDAPQDTVPQDTALQDTVPPDTVDTTVQEDTNAVPIDTTGQ